MHFIIHRVKERWRHISFTAKRWMESSMVLLTSQCETSIGWLPSLTQSQRDVWQLNLSWMFCYSILAGCFAESSCVCMIETVVIRSPLQKNTNLVIGLLIYLNYLECMGAVADKFCYIHVLSNYVLFIIYLDGYSCIAQGLN